jgi:hypothetical protein
MSTYLPLNFEELKILSGCQNPDEGLALLAENSISHAMNALGFDRKKYDSDSLKVWERLYEASIITLLHLYTKLGNRGCVKVLLTYRFNPLLRNEISKEFGIDIATLTKVP